MRVNPRATTARVPPAAIPLASSCHSNAFNRSCSLLKQPMENNEGQLFHMLAISAVASGATGHPEAPGREGWLPQSWQPPSEAGDTSSATSSTSVLIRHKE